MEFKKEEIKTYIKISEGQVEIFGDTISILSNLALLINKLYNYEVINDEILDYVIKVAKD